MSGDAIVPPDLQALFDDLVERHGGVTKFSTAQLEVATIAVKVMRDLRCAGVGDTVKLADTLVKLLERLPPALPQRRLDSAGRDWSKMSLVELSAEYARMMQGTDGPEGDDYDVSRPIIDLTVAPAAPARAPESDPPPSSYRPAPDDARAATAGQHF